MTITLKDIAKKANVSTATVSRVLNDKVVGNMRKETYEKIKTIINETNYTPHALASGLRKGLSKVIGVIFPDSVNPYYAQLGKVIEDECFKNGYLTLICNTNSDINRERDYIKLLISQRVSGIVVCSTGLSGKEIRNIPFKDKRVVLLDEEISDYNGRIVIGNDFLGGYLGAQYLYGLCHEDIVVITGPENLSSSRDRLNGFLEYITENGKSFNSQYIINGEYSLKSAYKELSKKLKEGLKFSAVFTFSDLMAIGAIKALNDSNLNVPEDISLLGYDNILFDELMKPGITTIATPFEELGRIAVKELIKNGKERKKRGNKIVLEPKLIVRNSCIRYIPNKINMKKGESNK